MDTQSNSPLTHTWKEQIRQVAARNPRLARQLWHNRQVYFDRFAHFYRQLANLPHKFRRKFLKRLATTLAGTALLLALGQALPVRGATITVDGVNCTLAEAITSANSNNAAGNGCVDGNGADILDLQTDVLLSASLPYINSVMTLEGNGHTIDGNNSFQVLNVYTSGNLTLNATIITGGNASSGGGISSRGTLTLNNSTLSGNSASVRGGGISNYYGTVTVNNSTLSGNSAGESGGGIFSFDTVALNNSTLSGNSAGLGGGGIYGPSNSTLTLNNSTLSGNSAGSGGGIGTSGTLTLNNSILSDNSASSQGGGIRNVGTLTLNDSALSGNSADSGGGIFNLNTAILKNSTLSGNSAGLGGGGGIFNLSGTLTLNNGTLSGNSGNNGGGIYNAGTLMLNDSTLRDNSGNFGIGGGIFNFETVTLNNSTLSGNSAHRGGGIYNRYGTVTLNNSTITGNSANEDAGGIFNKSSNYYNNSVNLNRSLISGNSASNGAEVFNQQTVNANNFNVVGYGGSARSNGFTPGATDRIPSGALNTVLDMTLANNGGLTFTHALVSGSVAIDVAPDAACTAPPIDGFDQRGYARNLDGNGAPSANECDAGAIEFGSSLPTPTPTQCVPAPTYTPTLPPPPLTPVPTPLGGEPFFLPLVQRGITPVPTCPPPLSIAP